MDENDRGIKLGIPRMNSLIVFLSILLFCEVTYGQQNRANSVPVKKNILVLNSYHVGYKWSDDITLAIRSKLAESGVDSELYIEFLDAKRFPDVSDLFRLFSVPEPGYDRVEFFNLQTWDST